MKLVITGGHHTSALPIIHKLISDYPNIEIFWIGHKHTLKGDKNDTLEYKEINMLNIPFYNLKAGKFYKTFNIMRLLLIPFGFIQAFFYLLKIKPDVVLSFGGYLAVPVVFDSWILGIPSITHEQTVVAGYANKFISIFAKKILVSWDSSLSLFPKHKTLVSGLPLRKSISEVRSNSFVFNNNLPVVYLTAGKTGSHKLNELVRESLSEILSYCNLIHQCGDNSVYDDYSDLENLYKEIDPMCVGQYFLRKYIYEEEIGEAYSKADIVVCRSGAHTISELLYLEKPSILIPISWVSHNEQYENAKLLESAGIGVILEEKDLNTDVFVNKIQEFLSNRRVYKIREDYKKPDFSNSENIIINEILKFQKQ